MHDVHWACALCVHVRHGMHAQLDMFAMHLL